MENRFESIISYLEFFENVQITEPFKENENFISGKIRIEESGVTLEFETEIKPQYPFQSHDVETIRFVNKELLPFNHVNADGSICIHTLHNPDLKSKLYFDIDSLKRWIKKYYVEGNQDKHYDHIVVTEHTDVIPKNCFLFTEVNYTFKKGDFGTFQYTFLARGFDHEADRDTFNVTRFLTGKSVVISNWSSFYLKREYKEGIYLFIEKAPVTNGRFIIENWQDLEKYVRQDFMSFLYQLKKKSPLKVGSEKNLPLLIGYNIPDNEIHWQCAMIDTDNFPNIGRDLGKGLGWIGQFKNMQIKWSSTKNCSYKYFFGRGKLSEKLTEKKILIIGIGAVGSIIATTLSRGGCKYISLADYDSKQPENVCRSEYSFDTGINVKVIDLGRRLIEISPFVEILPDSYLMDAIKYFINNKSLKEDIRKRIEEYDLIIDCTTDNDVAYILDSLCLQNEIICISITNNARELLCSVKPDLYHWIMNKNNDLQRGDEEMYEPLGCWNPTFKASYNDINVLVQFAMKHINVSLEQGKMLRHFYLSTELEEDLKIKLHQF
jgi:siroheme synthase (precorrin-2 oxidase/ferrochelatase)